MSESNTGKQTSEASPPAPGGEKKVARRQALLIFGIVLNAIAGTLFAIPVIGYVLSPGSRRAMKKDLGWVSLGELTQFPVGQTRLATFRNPSTRPWDGVTADIPCWVRRISEEKLQVFAVNCAHLGCPVRWFPQSELFMCPCHGGVYYADGSRASGPPPRGLFEYDYKVEQAKLWIKAGQMPTLASPMASATKTGGCSCA
jgi:Rieske Fe-S protein